MRLVHLDRLLVNQLSESESLVIEEEELKVTHPVSLKVNSDNFTHQSVFTGVAALEYHYM